MLKTTLQIVASGYDRKTCWMHARGGRFSDDPSKIVITLQKLTLSGADIFQELHDIRTEDGGATWSDPKPHTETLGRRMIEDDIQEGVSDFTPTWHPKSKVILGTGHTVRYLGNNLQPQPRPRNSVYSIYEPISRSWSAWQKLNLPDKPLFFNEGAGSTQRLDLPNGDILLPTYIGIKETAKNIFDIQDKVTVMRCNFDGNALNYAEHGTELTIPEGRGYSEPSLAYISGLYFLTLRNDLSSYVTVSEDGLHYGKPHQWRFDDGSDLGSYNTQQHWVTNRDNLYLVYTRSGANNDHISRHRAPLFIAKVDTANLSIIRDSEQIIVPERGASLGNFGVLQISDDEAWVIASETMQSPLSSYDNPENCLLCEKFGSNNSIFAAKIFFD